MAAQVRGARPTKGQPCPTCPWRRDSVGRVHPGDVAVLRQCALPNGPPQGCHNVPSRLCAGYLEREARNRPEVAIPAAMLGVNVFELQSTTPLFDDYPALFTAHGVPS